MYIYIYISNHGLIAQSVRVSEWNFVVVGSRPTRANILSFYTIFKEFFSGEYHIHIYIYIHTIYIYIYMYIYLYIYIYIYI